MTNQRHAFVSCSRLYVLGIFLKEREIRPVSGRTVIAVVATADGTVSIDNGLYLSGIANTGTTPRNVYTYNLRTAILILYSRFVVSVVKCIHRRREGVP